MVLTGAGYMVFYAASDFITAAIGFIILGFFITFANSGYMTFFQSNVPFDVMGRFSSLAELFQGVVQIILTLILGFLAEIFSLKLVCLLFSGITIFISLILCIVIFQPSKKAVYETKKEVTMN